MSDEQLEPAAYLTENPDNNLYWPWWSEDKEERKHDLEAARSRDGVSVEPLVRVSEVHDLLDEVQEDMGDEVRYWGDEHGIDPVDEQKMHERMWDLLDEKRRRLPAAEYEQ